MNPLLAIIAQKIWEHLQPWLESKWEEVKPKLFEFIKEQFQEWMPKILKTVLVGLSTAAGQLTVNTTDRVTEIIPGPIDDYVVNQLVDRMKNTLGEFGIRF